MSPSGKVGLPRELVRASAGTGKTFKISSRIIGLLAHGADPDAVLASTFTRAAAGEILERVLYRLATAALDGDRARELDRHARFDGVEDGSVRVDRDRALALLERLVRQLHRIDVGTLDSLFNRMARIFTLELGMLPGWSVANDSSPDARALRDRAIADVLTAEEEETLVELLRTASQGESTRRIHDRLTDLVDELQELRRELDPGAEDHWAPFPEARSLPDDPEATRQELADELATVEAPLNKSGTVNTPWRKALDAAVDALREGDWEAFWGAGPGKKHLEGDTTFSGKPFPGGLQEVLESARELRAAQLARELNEQALSDRQREAGLYRFRDVTHRLLAGSESVADRPELDHRMDRRAEHVLLDEFQDTSPAQWRALRPLVDRVAGGPADGAAGGAGRDEPGRADGDGSTAAGGGEPLTDHATVVVADPKQSIYGWRGADPRLVERVASRYGLEEERLDESYRSSPVVLDFVNRVFGDIAGNPVVSEVEHGPAVAREWARSFDQHRAAPPRRKEPGHVRVEVGPDDETRSSERPLLLARCADRVAELHEAAPEISIGVLTRTNRAVARLIHELRKRDVNAGEEGGTPVDDAAPVAAVLSLLRLADHPDDRIARYHVAATPLGEVLPYPYRDHDDDPGAAYLARSVRRDLIRDGYGATLAGWSRRLAPHVDAAEHHRLQQLVELGFRWDERAGLRPDEFVRFARSERVGDPRETPVQVMTVHQSKGLEFDAVFLADLESSLTGGAGGGETALPERDSETGLIRRVFPYVKKDLQPLLPEMDEAVRQHEASRFRDELSWLYVAMTRAKHSLRILLSADGESGPGSAKSPARLIRAALGVADEAVADGDVLFEEGPAEWHVALDRPAADQVSHGEPSTDVRRPPGAASAEPGLRIDPGRPRTRMLGRRTPSDLEGGDQVDPAHILTLKEHDAARRGDVVHRWCQEVTWIEDGIPDDEALLQLGRRAAPEMGVEALESLIQDFRRWLDRPAIRTALSRERALELASRTGTAVELEPQVVTERRLAFRHGDEVISGILDRLVLVRREPGGPAVAAEVADFKTDDFAPGDEASLESRLELYRPQLRAYRRGVASLYGLDPDDVAARLLFLVSGAIREVG